MRINKIFLLFFLFSLDVSILAQVDTAWVRKYNAPPNSGDVGKLIAVDANQNVYVTGIITESTTYRDYGTIKYAPNGNILWIKRYGLPGNSDEVVTGLAVDAGGNVYVTGYSGLFSGQDYATIKYKPNGDTAWVRRYNGTGNNTDWPYALAVDDSGNVYVTGRSRGSVDDDYATIKYKPNGDTAWVRRFNGPANLTDAGYALTVDANRNVYVTGTRTGGGPNYYSYVNTIKYAPNGDTVWVRYIVTSIYSHICRRIKVDNAGNVYVAGYREHPTTDVDYLTIKYKPNGDTAWVRTYNGPGNNVDSLADLELDGAGNVYVTGVSDGAGTSEDYATIKYAPNGDTLWVRRYNGPHSWDEAKALSVDANGNVYVTGNSRRGSGGIYSDYATIKYLPNGDQAWVIRYNGTGTSGGDGGSDVAVDDSGSVYVTGVSWSATSADYATIKYVQSAPSLVIQAFSPVDLIVVDPNNDSIGVSFNTISGASYSVSNDSIRIPTALAGNYKIKVKLDPLDLSGDTTYTLTVKMGGASAQVLVSGNHVPNTGETQTFIITSNPSNPSCFAKPGDANADNNILLSDIVNLINFLFKSQPAPVPFCRGDVNGNGTILLSDVISLVNFLFKSGAAPVKTGVCCL